MKLDKKDLQIMEILAQNCRVPNTTLGKALKISKDTVSYRIKRLEESNYLKEYILFVDARKLGFTRYHLLLRFESELNQETIEKLKHHKFVMWINTFIGRYDMQIIVDAKDGFHLNQIREELFDICDNEIKEYTVLTHLKDYEFTQLNPTLDFKTKFQKKLDHSFSEILTTRKFPVKKRFNKYFPTKTENKILHLLANNPRAGLTEISKELRIDRQTVKSRIINLIEKGIILNFGGIPNLSKMEYVTYYLLVRISQGTDPQILKKPFEELRNIFYAGQMIGDYDMILYLNARNPEELNESINLFKKEIQEHIEYYELLVKDKVHFWRQFTDGIYEALNQKTI